MALCCAWLVAVGCRNSRDELISQLLESDPQVRRSAARALGKSDGDASEAVAALSGALQDPDLEVRELAAASLGEIGPQAKPSLPALEQALQDPEHSVRVTAAFAIQKIDPDSQSYLPVLIAALRAGDGTVFLEVGRMGAGAKWAVPTLTALLSDRRAKIRALAAHALGGIGVEARDAESALKRTSRDQDAAVRKAAEKALRRIQSRKATAKKVS